MNILTDAENQIVDELRLAFYELVPAELRTFCSLTSRISQEVLNKFAIRNELMPCQLLFFTKMVKRLKENKASLAKRNLPLG